MFNSFVEFQYVTHRKGKPPGEDFEELHTYKFKFNKEIYLVQAERYQYDIFAIKFYPKSFEDSPNRYKKLTHKGNAPTIFRTCLNIMVDLVKRFPEASLGFIGEELVGEGKNQTKRFRIYKKLMENFFSPVHFHHKFYLDYSAYLLINKLSHSEDSIKEIEEMFWQIYNFGPESKDD